MSKCKSSCIWEKVVESVQKVCGVEVYALVQMGWFALLVSSLAQIPILFTIPLPYSSEYSAKIEMVFKRFLWGR